jgi:hypothetical protein
VARAAPELHIDGAVHVPSGCHERAVSRDHAAMAPRAVVTLWVRCGRRQPMAAPAGFLCPARRLPHGNRAAVTVGAAAGPRAGVVVRRSRPKRRKASQHDLGGTWGIDVTGAVDGGWDQMTLAARDDGVRVRFAEVPRMCADTGRGWTRRSEEIRRRRSERSLPVASCARGIAEVDDTVHVTRRSDETARCIDHGTVAVRTTVACGVRRGRW